MSERKFNLCKKLIISLFIILLFVRVISFMRFLSVKSFENKIASMVMVGFNGTKLTPDMSIYDELKNKNLGGIILYEKDSQKQPINITDEKQLLSLCSNIRNINHKILIAVDEEGGNVSRLNQDRGYERTNTAKEIANMKSYNKTRMWSKRISDKLSKANINFNLAPVVDLDINENSEALSKQGRMFSNDSSEVSIQASIFISEHRKKNILTSLKHFPGYGSALIDPHKDITDVTNSWNERELEPYKILLRSNLIDTIMTAHIINKNLDEEFPATLSKKIIGNILRKDIGYNGVVISDDLLMGAIVKKYSFENSIILAINAGVDILLFSKEYYEGKLVLDEVIKIVKNAVMRGEISKERIQESYNRITLLKDKLKY